MDDFSNNPVFREIVTLLQKELARQTDQVPSRRSALVEEKRQLELQIAGWTQSLGRPDLDSSVRRSLETTWAEAHCRLRELDQELLADENLEQRRRLEIDPQDVAERLEKFETILAGDNATAINFELALHIDEIRCTRDGQIEMRTCKLGIVPDVVPLVRGACGDLAARPGDNGDSTQPTPARRRTRLALPAENRLGQADLMEFALDPERFTGLPPQFFWIDSFGIPRRVTWTEAHAEEVYRRWKEDGLSKAQLAREFSKSIPTIREAIKVAQQRLAQELVESESEASETT
jgi:hypothetical protein